MRLNASQAGLACRSSVFDGDGLLMNGELPECQYSRDGYKNAVRIVCRVRLVV